jgi:predicted nucleic acid-binding protein
MIILDTNVVSEPLKPEPSRAVLEWLDRQAPASLFLTTINLAELLAGIEVLPAGRRKSQLHRAMLDDLLPLFEGRILAFAQSSAEAFARVNADAQAAGNTIDFADCAIASIAVSNRFILATRNERDFKGTGIALINPWAAPSR